VKVRYLADADLNNAIARGALRREPSLDFLTLRRPFKSIAQLKIPVGDEFEQCRIQVIA
jgi:hypothetical protein